MEKLIATGKLTLKSLNSILSVLALADDLGRLTVAQSRGLRHLLDYLIARSGLAGKHDTNAADWQSWLNANFSDGLMFHFGIVRIESHYFICLPQPKKSKIGGKS